MELATATTRITTATTTTTTFTFTSPPLPFAEQSIRFPPSLSALGSWTLAMEPLPGTIKGYCGPLQWEGVGDLTRIRKLEFSGSGEPLAKGAGVERWDGNLLPDLKKSRRGRIELFDLWPKLGGVAQLHLEVQSSGAAVESEADAETAGACFASSLSSRHPNNVRIYFPRLGRELWTSSALLSSKSTYYADLLTSGFPESSKKRRISQLDEEADRSGGPTSGGFDDSDDERDEAVALKGGDALTSQGEADCSHPFHEITVTETAYTTYRAVLIYLATGFISFAPLKSTLRAAGAPRGTPNGPSHNDVLSSPLRASPKSVYRLAHLLSLADLQALALNSISSQLTINSVAYELFSEDTAVYDELGDVVIACAADNWAEVKESQAMKELDAQVREEQLELSTKVSVKLMKLLS